MVGTKKVQAGLQQQQRQEQLNREQDQESNTLCFSGDHRVGVSQLLQLSWRGKNRWPPQMIHHYQPTINNRVLKLIHERILALFR